MVEPSQKLQLRVEIDPAEVTNAKKAGWSLCLAKSAISVDGSEKDGNVVFSRISSEDISTTVDFAWQENYQVFGAYEFEAGIPVKIGTNIHDISGGEIAVLQGDGTVPVTGKKEAGKPFRVCNKWHHPGCVGVNAYDLTPKTKTYSAIFVSPIIPIESTSTLLPIQKYFVFWTSSLKTNQMFFKNETNHYDFDLTTETSARIQYKGGKWEKL